MTIQIHLMFLFIQGSQQERDRFPAFKYISCSYLSFNGLLSETMEFDSNTSHVLIYHGGDGQLIPVIRHSNTSHVLIYLSALNLISSFSPTFKYISCSYLSKEFDMKTYTIEEFKYISCSYLSRRPSRNKCLPSLFKYISCSYLSEYQNHTLETVDIQIHLMFLFIFTNFGNYIDVTLSFKYISCSYLSR